MKYIRFKEYVDLQEMPITSFNKVGDWQVSNQYGYNRQDVNYLNNPQNIQKIHNAWSKSKHNFEIYFVRTPVAQNHIELGEVDADELYEILGIPIVPLIDRIYVIFTNNTGSEKVTISPWIMAHRLSHGITVPEGKPSKHKLLSHSMFNRMQTLISKCVKAYDFPKLSQDQTRLLIVYTIGTTKTCRKRTMRRPGELFHELTAQYLITGKIKLNPLPESIDGGGHVYHCKDLNLIKSINEKDIPDLINNLQTNYKYLFNLMRGKIILI